MHRDDELSTNPQTADSVDGPVLELHSTSTDHHRERRKLRVNWWDAVGWSMRDLASTR